HRATISPLPECPGYFVFRDIGLVFDKYGQMSAYYSSPRDEKIDVDFTYVDPDERAYTQLEVHHVYDKKEIDLMKMDFDGVYIGNNEFYCPYLHFWFLRAPTNMKLTIGAWYHLKIDEIHGEKYLVDVEAEIVPYYDPVPYKMVQKTPEFLVDISVHRVAGNQILVAPYIGPIGITDLELARFENFRAVAIQFPLGEEFPEDRPQRRPHVTRMFKTAEIGKSVGGYK
uniref:Hexamerin n=1 Tax=Panagrolaimus sp. ES5 TaxID=591445 RepID=A0AC34G115_9BILA